MRTLPVALLLLTTVAFMRALPARADTSEYEAWTRAENALSSSEKDCLSSHWDTCRAFAHLAQIELDKVESASPYSALRKRLPLERATAELWLAQADHSAGRYEIAFQLLADSQGLARIHPTELKDFRKLTKKNPSATATAWLARLAGLYPKNSEEFRALQSSPADSEASPHTSQSYKISTDPDLQMMDDAMHRLVQGEDSKAAEILDHLLRAYPKTTQKVRAKYWLGIALRKLGNAKDSERLFIQIQADSPLSYYAMLASHETGRPLEGFLIAENPVGATEDPKLQPAEVFKFARAQELLRANHPEWAALELSELPPRTAFSSEFLYTLTDLQARVGNLSLSFKCMGELFLRGDAAAPSTWGERRLFASAYEDEIRAAARAVLLDPVLLMSLVKQESAFDPTALSGAGALGLTQLMPATASDTQRGVERADLFDAKLNLQVGAIYLSKMLEKFDGDPAYALAAYNAGPQAVARWKAASLPGLTFEQRIELIPYRETREYVSTIMRNYYWYSKNGIR